MKKLLSLLLAVSMLALPAFSLADGYADGTYTAASQGLMSEVSATVTIAGGAITEVVIDASGETAGLGTEVAAPIAAAVVEAQSAAVDSVSGATVSSNAAMTAVQKCLDAAAGVVKEAAGFVPGTYTATAAGHNGPVTVEVTFTETEIASVTVVSQSETIGLGYGTSTAPIEALPAAIVAAQSLAVDAVTNATVSSAAVKAAVADCVKQAGGDPDALQPAPAAEAADEEYNVDVVIVGAGAAGLAAAKTAQEMGANVLVLEKAGVTGGSTVRSGGKLLAAGTVLQEAQGITDDTPEQLFDYLMSFDRDGIMDAAKVKAFCDNSAEIIDWLIACGAQFQDVEAIHSSITPWRVHNLLGGGGMVSGFGGRLTAPMTNIYENNGGKILYNTCATELITDENNAVVGVKAVKKDGSTVTVKAGSVILATGGYCQNPQMLAKYSAFLPSNIGTSVPATNTGDGITMAEKVGACVFDAPGLQLVYVNYSCYVGIAEEAGLITDIAGNRVVNEYTYQSHVAQALADAKSPVGYYITAVKDGMCIDPYRSLMWGVTLEGIPSAATVEELAAMVGMDPAVLSGTVARYNELCAAGNDEDFGKPADKMIAVEGEKYFAFPMYPGSSVTFGGLEIDTAAHVLDVNGQPIAGLFAAGEVANTGLFDAEYPTCGMAIGSAVYFGRIAAETALAK